MAYVILIVFLFKAKVVRINIGEQEIQFDISHFPTFPNKEFKYFYNSVTLVHIFSVKLKLFNKSLTF